MKNIEKDEVKNTILNFLYCFSVEARFGKKVSETDVLIK